MTSQDHPSATTLDIAPVTPARRVVWHAIAVALAAAIAWLIFAAYRQPELILDLANMRLC